MSAPRVSVVMPVYNGARYIAEAVSSVLGSDMPELELLVLDDGSTDPSIAEAERAAAGDARVRIFALPHGGVAAARNVGLREARAPFIANLDADDAMYPSRLTRQLAFLDTRREYVAVGSRALVVDQTGAPQRVGVRLFTHEEIDRAHLEGRGGAIWNPTATFRADVARAIGGYDVTLHTTGEDHDLWLRMAEVGKLCNLPEVLTRYRIHERNVSLDPADRERRLGVALQTVARAFERRGLTGRTPVKLPAPPATTSERVRDAALLRYFSGDRRGAMLRVMAACVLNPTGQGTRAAARTILNGSGPGRARPMSASTSHPATHRAP